MKHNCIMQHIWSSVRKLSAFIVQFSEIPVECSFAFIRKLAILEHLMSSPIGAPPFMGTLPMGSLRPPGTKRRNIHVFKNKNIEQMTLAMSRFPPQRATHYCRALMFPLMSAGTSCYTNSLVASDLILMWRQCNAKAFSWTFPAPNGMLSGFLWQISQCRWTKKCTYHIYIYICEATFYSLAFGTHETELDTLFIFWMKIWKAWILVQAAH